MSSARSYSEKRETRTDIITWNNPDRGRSNPAGGTRAAVGYSPRAIRHRQKDASETYSGQILFIIKLIEMLTGKKVKIVDPTSDCQSSSFEGWNRGIEINSTETYTEAETTVYAAEGTVEIEGGKTVSFSLDLAMEREFTATGTFSFRAGNLKDPLVINFSGSPATLTDETFAFDLNSDGLNEQMPFVGNGNGFLFVDRNGDGAATDGSELLGPLTTDGFSELAELDDDRNGWIDENDAAYKDLGVWTKDAAGTDVYRSLDEAAVGALYTGSVDTPFSIKDGDNATLGRVDRSGLYLKSTGDAGVLQKIDLAV